MTGLFAGGFLHRQDHGPSAPLPPFPPTCSKLKRKLHASLRAVRGPLDHPFSFEYLKNRTFEGLSRRYDPVPEEAYEGLPFPRSSPMLWELPM